MDGRFLLVAFLWGSSKKNNAPKAKALPSMQRAKVLNPAFARLTNRRHGADPVVVRQTLRRR
jgi:hypothetical protein